jgi:hypothetical protein
MVHIKKRDHFGDLGVDKGIILKLISEKQGLIVWTGFIWFSGWFL